MSTDGAHQHRWQIFEVVFGVPFVAAMTLHFAVPFSLRLGWLTPVIVFAGAAIAVVGTALVISARRELAQYGQPTDPGQPTERLVTTGVFSISRNPLYLGGICFLVGIALAFNLPWVLVFVIPACVVCHYVLVVPEETYLAAKFGEDHRLYAASVHRWIGRAR